MSVVEEYENKINYNFSTYSLYTIRYSDGKILKVALHPIRDDFFVEYKEGIKTIVRAEYVTKIIDTMGIHEIKYEEKNLQRIIISGKTYSIREELKKIGFKWNSTTKSWVKEVNDVGEAVDIVSKILGLMR